MGEVWDGRFWTRTLHTHRDGVVAVVRIPRASMFRIYKGSQGMLAMCANLQKEKPILRQGSIFE